MNRKFAFAIVMAVVLTAVAAVPASAADDQQQQAQQAMNDFTQTILPLQQQLEAKRMELANLMNSPAPDKARVEALFAEIGGLRGKLVAAGIEMNDKYGNAVAAPCGPGGMGMGMPGGRGYGYGCGYGRGGMMRRGGGYHCGW